MWYTNIVGRFFGLVTKYACDGQTDGRTDGQNYDSRDRASIGRSLGAKISGGRGHPWGIFFGFYKTRHILLSDSANCTVLRAVVLTQYRRVSDGQTDGNAIASTALAMRALRRAVKIVIPLYLDRIKENR